LETIKHVKINFTPLKTILTYKKLEPNIHEGWVGVKNVIIIKKKIMCLVIGE